MVGKNQTVEITSQKIIIEKFAELKFDWGVCSNNSKTGMFLMPRSTTLDL